MYDQSRIIKATYKIIKAYALHYTITVSNNNRYCQGRSPPVKPTV
jgi:hypothetical protein